MRIRQFVRWQFVLMMLVFAAAFAPAQSGFESGDTIRISGNEFDAGLFHWMGQHPETFPRGTVVKIHFPILDFYSAAGVSIYHGDDSAKNAAFIRALPRSIAGTKTESLRPTLKEAIEMFPGLKKREQALLSGSRYTAFVITYPGWERCKAQNDAIAELKKRSREAGVHVIEVEIQ